MLCDLRGGMSAMNRTNFLRFSGSDAELTMMKRAAQRLGITLSAFLRRAAIEAAESVNSSPRATLLGDSSGGMLQIKTRQR